MGVDYGVRVIYGYQLNQKIFRDIIKEKEAEDKDFYVYDWLEEIAEMSNCEIAYENHYIEVDDMRNVVYFGIPIYNKLTKEYDLAKVGVGQRANKNPRARGAFGGLNTTSTTKRFTKDTPIGGYTNTR
jgi:hypothetical protein